MTSQTCLRLLVLFAAIPWHGSPGEARGQEPPKPAAPPATVTSTDAEENPDLQAALERFREGNLGGALEALQKARAANPAMPPAKLMLARLLLNVDQLGIARALLEDVAAEDPTYPATYALFGSIALSEGRLSDAQLNYDQAHSLAPEAGGLSEAERDEIVNQALSGRAAVAERRQRWDTARTVLEELVARRPDDGNALQRLGRSLFQLDQPDEALARFESAVQVDPTLDPPRITMGWLLVDRGQFDEALAAMREAIRLDPENPAAHLGLATYLLQREQPREALSAVEAALDLAPDSLPAQQLLGAVAHRLDDLARAERQLDAVLAAAPEDVSTANLLALTLADQPDAAKHARAVELAEANLRRAGQNPQTLSTLGWSYYRAGRIDEALEVLQAATSTGQASADTAYYLACVLADKGQIAEAQQLLRSALEAPIGQFTAREKAQAKLKEFESTKPAAGSTGVK